LDFSSGKKKQQRKKDNFLQTFAAPEIFDGTVTVDAGGFFGTALDYAANLRDEGASVIQYRNMSIYPEVDNAIEEIVNASIVCGMDRKPVQTRYLKMFLLAEPIKTKTYREFDNIIHLLDFNSKSYGIFRRWYLSFKGIL
jgi:hypothetical protein